MSCDAVAFSAFLWLASAGPDPRAAPATLAAIAAVPRSVAGEPLFAGIVARAARLKAEAVAWRAGELSATATSLPGFPRFAANVGELAARDMRGHLVLLQRGTDGDLKCILKGIAQDLPAKLADLRSAATAKARGEALNQMIYLLRDNVEVITSPPSLPPA
ncbi:MAG: hypothetical protein ACYC8V_02880 [Caulobacteraceae bacterium]